MRSAPDSNAHESELEAIVVTNKKQANSTHVTGNSTHTLLPHVSPSATTLGTDTLGTDALGTDTRAPTPRVPTCPALS
jgi:hypothetical protein